MKCNYNAEEALRRLRFNVKVFSGKNLPAVLQYFFFQPAIILLCNPLKESFASVFSYSVFHSTEERLCCIVCLKILAADGLKLKYLRRLRHEDFTSQGQARVFLQERLHNCCFHVVQKVTHDKMEISPPCCC